MCVYVCMCRGYIPCTLEEDTCGYVGSCFCKGYGAYVAASKKWSLA